ncbi:MAG: phosphotransferase [Pseudomonadota bacterium]
MAQSTLQTLLDEHWGLAGPLEPLYAERDLNHRLTTERGQCWLVKLSHPDTGRRRLDFENRVLDALSNGTEGLRVPRIRTTHEGVLSLPLPDGTQLRVLAWLEGIALSDVDVTPAMGEALGRACARLNRALEPLSTTGALPANLPWDLLGLPALKPLAARLPDAGAMAMARSVVEHHEAETARALQALPRQPIHNDLNPDNVLVAPAKPNALPAIIDFGDMVRAPVLCDLAIACAYHVTDDGEPLRNVRTIVRGFHAERPLSEEEQTLLPALIAGRLCQTLLIQGARFAAGNKALANTYQQALRRLTALREVDPQTQVGVIRAVCRPGVS